MSVPVLRDDSGREYRVELTADGRVQLDGTILTVRHAADGTVRITGTDAALAWVATTGDTCWVFVDGRVFTLEADLSHGRRRRPAAHHAALSAPMPATVRKVLVNPGDRIAQGDVLLVLEAMKMELPVRATGDGMVERVHCREGDLVQPGARLIELSD